MPEAEKVEPPETWTEVIIIKNFVYPQKHGNKLLNQPTSRWDAIRLIGTG